MTRIKYKVENEKLTINSQVYFIGGAAVFAATDLAKQKCSLMMAWLEGEVLKTKALYEPQGVVTISKMIVQREKDAMLAMMSDKNIVIISSKDPKGLPPQIVKQQAKG